MKQGIPKSVQDLLARQTPGDEHPSADLLNGYVEHSLTAGEKARVANHLAVCADCRDVVFLASGAVEEVPELVVAAAAPPRREHMAIAATVAAPKTKWTWWKWAAPAVAVIAIVAGVLIERNRGPERAYPGHETLALSFPADSAAPTNQENAAVLSSPVEPATKASKVPPTESGKHSAGTRGNENFEQRRRIEEELARQRALQMAQISSSLENPHSNAAAGYAPNAVGLAPPPSSSQPAPVTSAAPPVGADNANLSANLAAAPPQQAANVPNGGNDLTYTAPAPSLKSGVARSNQSAAASTDLVSHKVVPVQWQITADGHLERALPGSAWMPVLADQQVAFRVVATVGADVWAGGNQGALFHSTDRGQNWNKVTLSANGQAEQGAIISIRFDSAQQGIVSTDTGVVWSTSNGGQSWVRK